MDLARGAAPLGAIASFNPAIRATGEHAIELVTVAG
ncbi:hypothetical protein QE360_001931 [Sphingomonas sp. SORGH_AS789]|nr:hypothetical protein [Sphingomonas sp. SORGH_AS_0789]